MGKRGGGVRLITILRTSRTSAVEWGLFPLVLTPHAIRGERYIVMNKRVWFIGEGKRKDVGPITILSTRHTSDSCSGKDPSSTRFFHNNKELFHNNKELGSFPACSHPSWKAGKAGLLLWERGGGGGRYLLLLWE